MRIDIGKYFEGRLLATIQLIKLIYDIGLGAGPDVSVRVQGRELVFTKGEENEGRGFLRATARETSVVIAFPRGHEIPDPRKLAKGARGSETRILLRAQHDVDLYVRRLIDTAYSLEE